MTDEPSVDGVSDEPSVDDAEASGEVRVMFWTLVVIVDLAMLATALGLVMLVLEDRPGIGGFLLVVGLLGFAVCYRRIRARRNT